MPGQPTYGSLDDFQRFLDAAHQAGMKVITELVLNRTSDQRPWFQWARRVDPGQPWREFYVWSDEPTKYQGARILRISEKLQDFPWRDRGR